MIHVLARINSFVQYICETGQTLGERLQKLLLLTIEREEK